MPKPLPLGTLCEMHVLHQKGEDKDICAFEGTGHSQCNVWTEVSCWARLTQGTPALTERACVPITLESDVAPPQANPTFRTNC